MSSNLATRLAEEHAAAAPALPSGVISAERRSEAIETLARLGLPSSREENWRYMNLRVLDRVRFAPPAAQATQKIDATQLPAQIAGYSRFTFIDGVFAPEYSSAAAPTGVSFESLRAARRAAEPQLASSLPDTRMALLNDAFAVDGAAVRVATGVDCPTCLELLFVATQETEAGTSYPRVELVLESNARLGIIERHVSAGSESSIINAAVGISIGDGAQVDHYRVQQTGAGATWFDTLTATVSRDARYGLRLVSLGGASARSTMHVQLLNPRASVSLDAVSVAGQRQIHDAFAMVEHVASHGRSEQTFRGIATGRSRVAFNSKVMVRETARGTDSQQSLRGLLAGPEAEIDVRPQLEIYTDDVKCAHGATAGKLDDNMMFYLLSRGLARATAQRLLEWAFLEDVVAKITVPELRRHIEQNLASRMPETESLKELL